MEELVDEVADWLSDTRPVNPRDAVRAVFEVLTRYVPPGQIAKIRKALPRRVRLAWESVEDSGRQPPPVRENYRRGDRPRWDH